MTTNATVIGALDDRTLLDAATRLATDERRATAALLRVLMELDRRRLYLGEGCASMFSYCTQVLHLAEGAACNRIEAARAARRYPVILELFEQSAITLTAVRLLAPHLTANNHAAVLSAATHKSKRQVEELVSSLRPQPDAPVVVRRLPASPVVPVASLVSAAAVRPVHPVAAESPSVATTSCEGLPSVPSACILPIAPERYRIQLTVSRETHDKFRRAQTLLRHALPSGDAAEIFESGPHAPGRAARTAALRRDRTPSRVEAERRGFAPHPGISAPSRLAAGFGSVRLRRWPRTLRGDGIARVPSRRAVCRWGRGDRTEYRAPLPRAQRLRGAALLRRRRRP